MLWLLPRQSFAPMVALLIALLQTLGVPISWKKLRLGYSLEYLGWLLCLESGPGCSRASMLEWRIKGCVSCEPLPDGFVIREA